ncbi:MAG: hypothetical protein IKH34_03960 [Oscillospiraceae bacterium]|nr:hypothetical protein [Oscillospiraceae bacterium]
MTEKQKRAIAILARSPTLTEAAKAAGISVSTLRRWRSQAEFKTAYRQALDEIIEDASRAARQSLGEAVEVLREIAKNTKAPTSSRVAAGRAILESGLRIIEASDILERLQSLENELREG